MEVLCIGCATQIRIDPYSIPYRGDLKCKACDLVMEAVLTYSEADRILRRKNLPYEELNPVWSRLNECECQSILEASLSFGARAFTASEVMSVRSLESVLRRTYGTNEMLGQLLSRVEADTRIKKLHGVLQYLKDARNRTAHPDITSSDLEARSTFDMTMRLLLEMGKASIF